MRWEWLPKGDCLHIRPDLNGPKTMNSNTSRSTLVDDAPDMCLNRPENPDFGPDGEADGPKRRKRVRVVHVTPTILIDTREQAPLVIQAFPTERATLPVGDYGVRGFSDWTRPAFIVERKSLNDLLGSITTGRDRFMREIERMRQFGFRALVIEATQDDVELGQYRSGMPPKSVLATLDALAVRTNVHVFWCGNATGAARQVESLVRQFTRGLLKDARRLGVNCNLVV